MDADPTYSTQPWMQGKTQFSSKEAAIDLAMGDAKEGDVGPVEQDPSI